MPHHYYHRRRTGPKPQHPTQPKPQTLSNKLVSKNGEVDVTRFINKAIVQEQAEHYQAQHTFDQFGLDGRLVNNIKARGYVNPTPIQDQALEPVLAGRDVIGLANTGTGKTAAFLLPMLHRVLNGQTGASLIVVPTRELATQIDDEFEIFRGHLPVRSVVIVGGESVNRQIKALRRRPQIIIGTPGRLKDLINQQELQLHDCRTLVLDEVDRMLDMGFIRDIRFILERIPEQKQSLFFSATMTPEIDQLARTMLKDPVTISVRTRETSDHVEQSVIEVKDRDAKLDKLEELLKQPEFEKVLVFGGTKWGVEKISRKLLKQGFKVAAIHGNKSQPQRQRALNDFKAGQIQALIATDVAARGLDISAVSHVINFDIPHTYEEYVHRIGRTGRAGHTGQAITLVQTDIHNLG